MFKTVLIGSGKISEQHLKALKGINQVEVEGICDLSPSLSKFTSERFGISNWYTDYNKMLSELRPDFVHVLTPPVTHNKIVRDSVDSGANVIVEKPIALSNNEFRELFQYASSKGVTIVENHNYRFNSPILKMTEALKSGKIGNVTEVDVRMVLNIKGGGRYSDPNLPHPSHKLPAGVLHEYITHLVYLMLEFMPDGTVDKLDMVKAAWRNHGGGDFFKYDNLDALIISNGIHGRIRFSCNQWPDCFSVDVRGTEGALSAELYNPVFLETIMRAGGKHLTPLINAVKSGRVLCKSGYSGLWNKIKDISAYDGLYRHLELIYESFLNKSDMPVGYKQMDDTSRIIDELLREENQI